MSEELNCSDGAKLLIEQMKADPEKFAKYRPWQDLIDHAINTAEGRHYSKVMSRRDAQALYEAYETHILEPKLAERVINELMEPKEKEKKAKVLMTPTNMQQQMLKLMEDQYDKAYKDKLLRADYERQRAAQQGVGFGGLGALQNKAWW